VTTRADWYWFKVFKSHLSNNRKVFFVMIAQKGYPAIDEKTVWGACEYRKHERDQLFALCVVY